MSFWEQLTDGLQMHEVLLFVLGSLLFLVLLFLLVRDVLKKEKINVLLFFFIIPVVMIGWPSIAKIQISEAGIALENTLRAYEKNPENPETRETLRAQVEELENKNVNNPKALINIAKANYILGNDGDALQTIDKIPDDVKEDLGGNKLKSTILITQDIEHKLQQAEQAPTPDNLEDLRAAKNQLPHQAVNNVRLHQYLKRADSLIQKND